MINFFLHYQGHDLAGLYEYEPAQTETDIDPPIAAIATICEIYIDGGLSESLEFINPAVIQKLEAMLVEGCTE